MIVRSVICGLLSLFVVTPAVAGWETVKEFYGTITIMQHLDYEAQLDEQRQILRKEVHAQVSVTGSVFDGAYYWPVGTITGTISSENIMIDKDGNAAHGTFSGKIDQHFDGERHGGPGLRVNKQEGLYKISLPHLYAKGTATMTVPVLGTSKNPDSEDDARPFMPARYREGEVSYSPEAGVIVGGFTHPEEFPRHPKPMVVTTTANWNLSFDLPPLEADAGGAKSVNRGETVTLDGSGSKGRIVSYTWTFEDPRDCPRRTDVSRSEMRGATVEVTALCSFTARLSITDVADDDTDTAAVTVRPREWKTPFEHVGDEGILDPSVRPIYDKNYPSIYNGGANACSVDGQTTEDSHIFHPPAKDGSWEGDGYTLRLVDDGGGPFDGFWYPEEYTLRVTRQSLLNEFIVKDGTQMWRGLGNMYDKNKAAGKPIEAYLAAVRDHEKRHSRRFKAWLEGNDPAAELEEMARQDRDELKSELDEKLREAESAICHAGKDPLPVSWKGDLWFGHPNGVAWELGGTVVGGPNQIQVECP